jgi:chromate transporter
MKPASLLMTLAIEFVLLSLLAVGGANAVIPEIQRVAVDQHHWLTNTQFVDLFAIAQAVPGPNVLIVTLVGWHVAGIPGALVTTAAMCAPSCLLTFGVHRAWRRFHHSPLRLLLQRALVPVAVGLILASGIVLTRAAGTDWKYIFVSLVTAAVAFGTKWNPLWILGAAAVLGAVGWL